MSSPRNKNKSLNTSGKSLLQLRPSHPARGVAHVTNARWDAMDATASGAQGIAGRIDLRERLSGGRTDGAANCLRRNWPDRDEVRPALWRDGRGRRNGVVPTPPGWRQVVWRCTGPTGLAYIVNPQGDGGKVQGSPRRSPISRNPSRRESRDDPVHLWSTRALHVHDRGCIGARLSLRPLLFEGVKLKQTSGVPRRENADVYLEKCYRDDKTHRCHRPAKARSAASH